MNRWERTLRLCKYYKINRFGFIFHVWILLSIFFNLFPSFVSFFFSISRSFRQPSRRITPNDVDWFKLFLPFQLYSIYFNLLITQSVDGHDILNFAKRFVMAMRACAVTTPIIEYYRRLRISSSVLSPHTRL